MHHASRLFLALAFLAAFTTVTLAQERPAERPGSAGERAGRPAVGTERGQGGGLLALLPSDAVSERSLDTGKGRLDYTATAGTLSLYDQSGERIAAIFYTSYVLKGPAVETRPVTFVFNGGPGAASAFLHLGLVGPRILDFGPEGRDGAANARLRDNPESWLAFTDLVMIDPIGTGWSRTAKPDAASNYYGVNSDAQVLAKTVALYLAHAGRTGSPKYLLGESYGGLRAAKVAQTLRSEQGLIINGIIMVSPLIEGALQFGSDRFALGAALQLPSLAAVELERRRAFSAEALAAAERFALTEYLTTLAGRPPEGEAARRFYARVAEITGLPEDVVARARGFIRGNYVKHLRGADNQVVSSYDASFAVPDPFPESDSNRGADPVLDGFVRAYGGVFAGYARNELGFKTEMTYQLLAGEVTQKWNWQGDGGRLTAASASGDLRELLALDPSFRLLVVHGYGDLVVPYAVNRYVLDHIPRIGAPDRVQLKLYRGGHMFYTIQQSRSAVTADARAFYAAPTQ